jgi:ketosteroid isomerase-like protein
MSLPDEVVAELAIRRVLATYCHRCDDGDLDAVVELFTSDGVFSSGDVVARGRAALRDFFDARQGRAEQRGRHLTVNSAVHVDGDHATAVSDFVFLRRVDGAAVPAIVGRYHDALVHDAGVWRFAQRDVHGWTGPS